MRGLISDIQKFSLHDGPGIRTTVFLKGCNLKCIWCHNPEAISAQPQIAVYPEKCISCGACASACPNGALKLIDGKQVFEDSACARCGACARKCPSGARTMIGQWREVNDVFAELAADLPYYGKSGGGVTLSGGEPLMQVDFCAELLQRCFEAGVDTVIETNLSLPYERLERLLPWLKRVFFDIKLMDDEMCKKYTGGSIGPVLENSMKLGRAGLPLVVRTPLIPGITDSPDNIRAIAQWVAKIGNVAYYELLNYNVLAKAKYEPIGLTYALPDASPLPKEKVEALAKEAQLTGIKVLFGQE